MDTRAKLEILPLFCEKNIQFPASNCMVDENRVLQIEQCNTD